MTHLASSLRQHYIKKDRYIIFTGGISLQEMALHMWQELGFKKVDVSVLSRVLSGEREFTPQQLFMFCKILNLPTEEVEHLFHSLTLDYWKRDGVWIDQPFIPTKDVTGLLDAYLKETEKTQDRNSAIITVMTFLNHVEKYQSKTRK